MSASILVAGATGLIGSEVVRQALPDDRISRVAVLVRRPIGAAHPKLEEWIARDGDLLSGLVDKKVDAVVCCLGTTIRTVGGDKGRFIHVDKDLVLGLARWAKAQGVPSFAVVSAMGADAQSRVFYSRVKGEMEEGLRGIGIERLSIFQPSILTGPRKEFRLGERIGIVAMKLAGPLLFGAMADLKPMPSDLLARALINASVGNQRPPGTRVLRYRDIVGMART